MPRLNNFNKSTGSRKVHDEQYTPKVLAEVIRDYIPTSWTIWCPFDTKESEFVYSLEENGNKVIYTHISTGQDFFEYEPKENYDCIISNPPFSKKLRVLERLYSLGKPFAIILGLPILNYQCIGEFFLGRDLQLLIVDKKVSFNGNTSSFNNSYFCRGILPSGIVFHHLPHNNSGKNYIGSRMVLSNLRTEN